MPAISGDKERDEYKTYIKNTNICFLFTVLLKNIELFFLLNLITHLRYYGLYSDTLNLWGTFAVSLL